MPKKDKLQPINSVNLEGETIKKVLHIDIGGSDKTFLFFESGRVMVLPVYRECPVQMGQDVVDAIVREVEKQQAQVMSESANLINTLRGI